MQTEFMFLVTIEVKKFAGEYQLRKMTELASNSQEATQKVKDYCKVFGLETRYVTSCVQI